MDQHQINIHTQRLPNVSGSGQGLLGHHRLGTSPRHLSNIRGTVTEN